jgi:uncharacterized damage-inducible protein DinB
MVSRIKWFDRQFKFGLPAEAAPELIERMRGTPARARERTQGLDTRTLTAAPPSGGWSIQEHVGHLFDLDLLFQARLDDYAAARPILHAADLTNRATTEAHHNDHTLSEVLGNFEQRRAAVVARLEKLDAQDLRRSAEHPRLKVPMQLVDMIFFQAEHDDYHLTSITELRRTAA